MRDNNTLRFGRVFAIMKRPFVRALKCHTCHRRKAECVNFYCLPLCALSLRACVRVCFSCLCKSLSVCVCVLVMFSQPCWFCPLCPHTYTFVCLCSFLGTLTWHFAFRISLLLLLLCLLILHKMPFNLVVAFFAVAAAVWLFELPFSRLLCMWVSWVCSW